MAEVTENADTESAEPNDDALDRIGKASADASYNFGMAMIQGSPSSADVVSAIMLGMTWGLLSCMNTMAPGSALEDVRKQAIEYVRFWEKTMREREREATKH